MQRRVQQPDRDRQPFHDPEQLDEIGPLHGQNLGQGGPPAGLVVRQDHLAHRGDPGRIEEHMLCPAQADALGAELPRRGGVHRSLGVRPHLQPPEGVGPAHQRGEVAGKLRLDHLDHARQHLAGRAVDGDDVPRLEGAASHAHFAGLQVDANFPSARDTGPAHAARHHRRVAGHAAPRRHDAAGSIHAANVLRAGLFTNQDHRPGRATLHFRLGGGEDDLAGGRAGRRRQARGDHLAIGRRVDGRVQQLVQAGGLDPHHRLFPTDQPLARQVDGHLQRRLCGPLSVAGLQHVEPAFFDRELDILHVAVVRLELLDDGLELHEHVRQGLFHRRVLFAHLLAGDLGQGLGRADPGHHVLALGVDQEFAVQSIFARGWVAGKSHARRRCLAHVAEHHRLDVHRRAPALRDVVHAPIELGPVVHPAGEHCADGAPDLGVDILGERFVALALDQGLVVADHRLPVAGA